MADRLRALLDRPLDPSAARAILIFASAILVGFAALFVLGASQSDSTSPSPPSRIASSPSPPVPIETAEDESAKVQAAPHRQDPQDVEGSRAARRADRALRSHRALQHVPYRQGALRVKIVGARGRRAVLRVSAPTIGEARRGWRRFLRRFRDAGSAYIPSFAAGARGVAR